MNAVEIQIDQIENTTEFVLPEQIAASLNSADSAPWPSLTWIFWLE
jgi:hypothetical protein